MDIETTLKAAGKVAKLFAVAAGFSACGRADTATARSCRLVAGLEFSGTVTDPTGREQSTTMSLTRVSGAAVGGRVIFNGSVRGTDTWITDSATTFVQNGQTRMLTTTGDTLALSCTDAKRTLSCESASRGKCLLTEVTH